MDNEQGVQETSPSPLVDAIASSPEALEDVKQQVSDTQTPTAEQGVNQEQEEQRVPYSRFKDVNEEKNYWREMALKNAQSQQPQLQQPTTPQELGNTPEEREFWQLQRRIAREEAQKEQAKFIPVLDAARQELARIGVILFRKDYPDIVPNSPDEIAIADRIRNGYPMDEAYKVVMWDKKVAQAGKQTNDVNKQRVEAKRQANVEQQSIPQGAKPPIKENLTLRQRIERNARDMQF